MQEKVYNMCLAIAKLAGNNVRRSICAENGYTDTKNVAIKFKDKAALTETIDEIMRTNKADTTGIFSKKAAQQLIIKTRTKIIHEVDNGRIFTESVLKSKDSRNCQKMLIDYLIAERYFKEAFDYDKANPSKSRSTAMNKAKKIITDMFSINFVSNFYFPKNKAPFLDEGLRDQLYNRAFDPMYSFTNEDKLMAMMQKKYLKDLSSKKNYFSADESTMKKTFALDSFMSRLRRPKSEEVEKRTQEVAANAVRPMISVDLYQEVFQRMPQKKRKRRFINVKMRHKDIITCSKKELSSKRQFADIERMTKNNFIHDCYMDMVRNEYEEVPSEKELSRYFFKKEAEMYRKLWDIEGSVSYKNGCIYFPDGSISVLVRNMEPHEMLHKINCIYAALFGFTGEDVSNPSNWFYNVIRSSYTDEGNALYRLSMIEAREVGRL